MEQKPTQFPKDISTQATNTESNLISFNSATKPHADEGAECEDEEMTKNLPDGYQDGKEGTSTYEQFLKRVHTLAMGNDKRENNSYNGNNQQDCVHDLSGTGSIASLQSFGQMERQITPLGEATLCTEIGWESRYRDLESRFRSLDRQVHDIVRENKIMRNIVIQNDNQGCNICQHMLAQITQLGKEIQAALSSNSQDEMTHKHVPAKMPKLDQCEDTTQRSRDQHVLKTSYPGSGAEMLQSSQIHEKAGLMLATPNECVPIGSDCQDGGVADHIRAAQAAYGADPTLQQGVSNFNHANPTLQQGASNFNHANPTLQQDASNFHHPDETINRNLYVDMLDAEKVNNKPQSEPKKPTPQMAAAGANVNTVRISQNLQEESATRDDSNEIHLLLIGNSGNGKSATGNSILNKAVFKKTSSTSVEYSSCLKSIVKASTDIGDKAVHVIDGPSINYSETMQKEDWEMIMKAVDKSLELCNCAFNALLITLKFGNHFTNQEREAIRVIKAVFGENVIKDYGICIFTYGDNFDNAVEEASEFRKILTFVSWLKEQTGERKNLIEECNNRCVLFDNSTRDLNKKEVQVQNLLALLPQGKKYSEKEFLQAEEGQHQLASVASLPAMMEDMQRVTEKIEGDIKEIEKDNDEDMETYILRMTTLLSLLEHLNNSLLKTGLTTPDVDSMKMRIKMLNFRIDAKIKQRQANDEIKKYTESKNRSLMHKAGSGKNVGPKKLELVKNETHPRRVEPQNNISQTDAGFDLVSFSNRITPQREYMNISEAPAGHVFPMGQNSADDIKDSISVFYFIKRRISKYVGHFSK